MSQTFAFSADKEEESGVVSGNQRNGDSLNKQGGISVKKSDSGVRYCVCNICPSRI